MTFEKLARLLVPVALIAAAASCAARSDDTPAAGANFAARVRPGTSRIQHVVIIVQENRTVDDLFNGFPGANTAQSGKNSQGQTVQLQSISLTAPYDISHRHTAFTTEYANGNMNGFDLVPSHCERHSPPSQCPPANVRAYGYVPQYQVTEYWKMAQQYAFADDMFETNEGPSFPAHQYIVSGTSTIDYSSSLRASEEPTSPGGAYTGGCDSPSGSRGTVIDKNGNENLSVYPCFNRVSLMAEADAASVTWRYYQSHRRAGAWNAPDAVKPVRQSPGYDKKVINPPSHVLTDIANGNLANIVWVTPTLAASDHAGQNDGTGPSWVASVVNAIGNSQYWSSTAIFVVWDDWGGWYDHVSPTILNSYELGFRVPLIVISPYAKQGYVSHVLHEFGSILKFAEEQFGLPSLGTTDARADDFADCFSFGSPPRQFKAIRAKYSARYFLAQPYSNHDPAPDD